MRATPASLPPMSKPTDVFPTLSIDPAGRRKAARGDSEFFFISTGYLDAYLGLLDGIRQHHGLLVLTGEAGTGKTLLLRKLVAEAPARIKCVLCYSTNLSFEELLGIIADQLGLPVSGRDRAQQLSQLRDYLLGRAQEGVLVALLIDEAHHLTEPVLDELLELSGARSPSGRLLQIVLCGMPELETRLTGRPDQATPLASTVFIRLERLNTAEVAAFIDRQWQPAEGPSQAALFNPPVVEQIAAYSRGIPRLINLLCERVLLIAQLTGQGTLSVEMIEEAADELLLSPLPAAPAPARVAATFSNPFDSEGNVNRLRQPAGEPATATPDSTSPRRLHRLAAADADEPITLVPRNQLPPSPPPIEHGDYAALLSKLQLLLLALFLAGLLGGGGGVYVLYYLHRDSSQLNASVTVPSPAVRSPTAPATTLEPRSPVTPPTVAPTVPVAVVEPLATVGAPPPTDGIPAPLVVPSPPPGTGTAPTPALTLAASSQLRHGDRLLALGDVAAARLFYEAAAATGDVSAITAVGTTFDPRLLSQRGLKDPPADPVKAAEWYLKAWQAGDPEAAVYLDGLRRWLADAPPLNESEAQTLQQLLR